METLLAPPVSGKPLNSHTVASENFNGYTDDQIIQNGWHESGGDVECNVTMETAPTKECKPDKSFEETGEKTGSFEQRNSEALDDVSGKQLEEMELMLRRRCGFGGPWGLFASPLGGRGLVATRDICAGQLILTDPPLVLVPQAASAPLCMRCHRRSDSMRPCERCGMPVCCTPTESATDHHASECLLLTKWGVRAPCDEKVWSRPLVRACAAVRCLALPSHDRLVVAAMQANPHPRHGTEIELLLRLARAGVPASELQQLRRAARVLDTNAFETPVDGSRRPEALECRLRGLYPCGAMMNHTCSPNTTHGYDARHAMVVRAAVDIPRGCEICTSYAPLLWGTPARRSHLADSKNFLCACERCRDPKELGSFLSGLRCGRGGCEGAVVCTLPLDASSAWQCCQCSRRLSARQAGAVQAALGAMLAAVNTSDADAVANFLSGRRAAATLYPTNQVAVELKSCLVWLYGHHDKHLWEDLSDDQLRLKEELCRSLLRLLELLRVGSCRLRGLFLYELHCTLSEIMKRRLNHEDSRGPAIDELVSTLQEAATIFRMEAMGPEDLANRMAALQQPL